MKSKFINFSSIITIFVIISVIRFISVFDDFKTNLGVFLRPGDKIYSVPYYIVLLFVVIAVFALFYLTKTLRRADTS